MAGTLAAPHGDGGITSSLALARLLPNGTLDASFGGGDGVVATKAADGSPAVGSDLALQPDGRILVGGAAYYCCVRFGPYLPTPMLVRFTADGAIDQSFGDDGDGEQLGGCSASVRLARIQHRENGIIGVGGTCQLLYPSDGAGVETIRDRTVPDPADGRLQLQPVLNRGNRCGASRWGPLPRYRLRGRRRPRPVYGARGP